VIPTFDVEHSIVVLGAKNSIKPDLARLRHHQPVEKIVDDKDAQSQYEVMALSREYFVTLLVFLTLCF
jgi:hypothetical protein